MSETKKDTTKDIFPIKSTNEVSIVTVDREKRNENVKKMIAASDKDVLFIDFRHEGITVDPGDVIIEKAESDDKKKFVYIANVGESNSMSDEIKAILVKAAKEALDAVKIKTKDITVIVMDDGKTDHLSIGLIVESIFNQPVFVEKITGTDVAFSLEMGPTKKKDKKKKKKNKKKGKK